MKPALPVGVRLHQAECFEDDRGSVYEIYRRNWPGAPPLLQWNFVHCAPNTVRGMHTHIAHTDHMVALSGSFVFGLRDIRRDSPTYGLAVLLPLGGAPLRLLTIPPGIAHGFACLEAGSQVYGMSHYWSAADDLACRWDDPALGFRLPIETPVLSDRDAKAGTLADLEEAYALRTSSAVVR